jgi:hemolysin-activating ACP:hemolysin acyltransferase
MGKELMDFYKIIHLFRQFKKYDKFNYAQLVDEITPSINLGQYQLFYKDNNLAGFINWAFITDTVEQRYIATGKLKKNEWNCGDNIWIVSCVAKTNFKDIYKWCKDYFKSITEEHQKVKWIRTNNINHIYKQFQTEHRKYVY